MARYITAAELTVGTAFVDPHRAERRMARVVTLNGVRDGKVFLELDDDTPFGPWVASYPDTEQLELA
jgi:adenylylsulfate kinase-like enzyme